jgi:hypothetical protein
VPERSARLGRAQSAAPSGIHLCELGLYEWRSRGMPAPAGTRWHIVEGEGAEDASVPLCLSPGLPGRWRRLDSNSGLARGV